VTGPNGLTTTFSLDDWGRVVRETAPQTSSYSDFTNESCTGSTCKHPEAAYRVTEFRTGRGTTFTEFDRLGREVAVAETAFSTGWIRRETYYDPLGRAYATSAPYREGQTRFFQWRKFDPVGRVW
jgi:hypothetical protein